MEGEVDEWYEKALYSLLVLAATEVEGGRGSGQELADERWVRSE